MADLEKRLSFALKAGDKADLKDFPMATRWWVDWRGGGHTTATDPGNRGWRAGRAAPGSDLVIIGRRGVKGCFSARLLSDGKVDVATYDEMTPEEVAVATKRYADIFRIVEFVPGWGLQFVDELEMPGRVDCTCIQCASTFKGHRSQTFCSDACTESHDREAYGF